MIDRYGADNIDEHFADTSDTLCYATNENQNATYALIEHGADIALVVGGYNSSNTSHIAELCAGAVPTFFIQNSDEIVAAGRIRHYSLDTRSTIVTDNWLPSKRPLDIILTCGASCPDATMDEILTRVLSLFDSPMAIEEVMRAFSEDENGS